MEPYWTRSKGRLGEQANTGGGSSSRSNKSAAEADNVRSDTVGSRGGRGRRRGTQRPRGRIPRKTPRVLAIGGESESGSGSQQSVTDPLTKKPRERIVRPEYIKVIKERGNDNS
jgi:hypothetical protein